MKVHPRLAGSQWLRYGQDGSAWLVSGEIDYDTAGLFRQLLQSAADRSGPIILDMCDVSFMDTSGVRELLRVCHAGREVIVRRPSPCVELIVQLTHLDQVLTV